MVSQRRITFIYFIFVILTVLTLLPVALYFYGYRSLWLHYIHIYFYAILVYVWYRFVNLAYGEMRTERFSVNLFTPFTVIVPCYNEEPKLLERCIHSVERAHGEKKIIIVDDGSTNGIIETMAMLQKKYSNIIIHRFSQNLGKRHAMFWAFQKIHDEFVVTIDSDTLVGKYAFSYLLAPFCDKKIGATTGNIRLLNEKKNLLTRIIAAMYLSGISNYKRSQSTLGNVTCCSGCLSAYRTELIREIAHLFVNQTFLGSIARHSEDRHLTNLILEKKYKVVYVEKAICYTESPHTLKAFLKQQQRWKRGFVRELIYLLGHSHKDSSSLFFEAWIGNALPYFLSLGIQLFIITSIFIDPAILLPLLISWFIFMTVRELPMFLDDPKRAVWFYFYIPLYEFLFFWQNMWAIFTITDGRWLTRGLHTERRPLQTVEPYNDEGIFALQNPIIIKN